MASFVWNQRYIPLYLAAIWLCTVLFMLIFYSSIYKTLENNYIKLFSMTSALTACKSYCMLIVLEEEIDTNVGCPQSTNKTNRAKKVVHV